MDLKAWLGKAAHPHKKGQKIILKGNVVYFKEKNANKMTMHG